jgi:hypothetical protein
LFEYAPGCRFFDNSTRLCLGQIFERNSLDEICDDIDMLGSVDQIVEFDHPRMVQSLENSDLPLSCFAFHRVCKSVLFVNFHSLLFICPFVLYDFDGSVGTLSYYSSNLIVCQLTLFLRSFLAFSLLNAEICVLVAGGLFAWHGDSMTR